MEDACKIANLGQHHRGLLDGEMTCGLCDFGERQ